jgi:adhesin transport system outer membrane protein
MKTLQTLRLCHWVRVTLASSMILLSAACAPTIPRSYVVLIPDLDGAVGRVIVSGEKGQQVLTQAGQVAGTDGRPVEATMDAQQLARDFGEAKASQPLRPEHFMLYFVSGGTRLTAESELDFLEILNRWKARERQVGIEIVVVGHTDRVGSAENNINLSMQRAKAVAERLRAAGMNSSALTLESHGEKQPLIYTQDGVPEPRNRRVQVTIR